MTGLVNSNPETSWKLSQKRALRSSINARLLPFVHFEHRISDLGKLTMLEQRRDAEILETKESACCPV
jgi:hypothetical protein